MSLGKEREEKRSRTKKTFFYQKFYSLLSIIFLILFCKSLLERMRFVTVVDLICGEEGVCPRGTICVRPNHYADPTFCLDQGYLTQDMALPFLCDTASSTESVPTTGIPVPVVEAESGHVLVSY